MAFKIGDPKRREKQGDMPIAAEGVLMGITLLIAASVLYLIGFKSVSCWIVGLAVFVAYFFRDPERVISSDPRVIVSPADGRIVRIENVPGEGPKPDTVEISIFLSIFNVHIQRCPLAGQINKIDYKPGSFKNAFNQEASTVNEQNEVVILHEGNPFIVKQIAGLIARRIVCWLEKDSVVNKGERFGLIQFGSRVDLIMPQVLVDLNVKQGDKVKGGSSIIAYLKKED